MVADSRIYGGESVDERRRSRRVRFRDAALELFGANGYAATPVPAICKAAGLSTRQFYQDFSDREHLLRDLYDSIQDRSMTAVANAVAIALRADANLEAVLRAAVEAFVSVYEEDARMTRVAFIEVVGVSPALEAHRHERRQQWTEQLRGVLLDAEAHGLPVSHTGRLGWVAYLGAVNAAIVERANDPSITRVELLDTMQTLLRPGILG
ncbi:TetR/AcrR family transcriptional regulator [Gordonia sp. CPCC 205333]|uniref:TetR/AcrR family transcriptional regulator n=1 Tax=Gordonia sp. CPCC 205333 TaxID=3140790 RepID=UPI003AF3695D